MWSLYMPMHVKSCPKAKLGQVEVGSNIAQNHLFSHMWSYVVIISANACEKLTKSNTCIR